MDMRYRFCCRIIIFLLAALLPIGPCLYAEEAKSVSIPTGSPAKSKSEGKAASKGKVSNSPAPKGQIAPSTASPSGGGAFRGAPMGAQPTPHGEWVSANPSADFKQATPLNPTGPIKLGTKSLADTVPEMKEIEKKGAAQLKSTSKITPNMKWKATKAKPPLKAIQLPTTVNFTPMKWKQEMTSVRTLTPRIQTILPQQPADRKLKSRKRDDPFAAHAPRGGGASSSGPSDSSP